MKKAQYLLPLIIVSVVITNLLEAQTIAIDVLQHAHAHNDYAKKNPLWDALEQGCASIEIDVFAFENSLRVAHVNLGLKKKKTLSELYLDPLHDIFKTKGYIYKGQPLVLMIDFKSNSDVSLALLRTAIAPMQEMFSYYSNGKIVSSALQIVISGRGIQYEQIAQDERVYFFKDGSVHECETDFPAALVPRGSTSYGSQFRWKGKKEMPSDELSKLRAMVEEANTCNKKLRFYAMPAREKIWEKFLEEGVYWINIDHPNKFKKFYNAL